MPIVFLISATLTDLKHHKIKNYATYPLIGLGLLHAIYCNGMEGLFISLQCLTLTGVLLMLLPGFKSGGGDIKLAAGCGAWLTGNREALTFLFFALLLAVSANLLTALIKQGKREFWGYLKAEILTAGTVGMQFRSVAMAPFMSLAYVLVIFLR